MLVVVRPGALVHERGGRVVQVGPAVTHDRQRDEQRRPGVGPPQPETDAEDAGDGAGRGHPVGLLHVGVGVEDLVVELLGQRQLHPAEDERADARVDHRRHHQPARPERVAEQPDRADRRVLGAQQAHRGVDGQQQADRQQRDGRGQVADPRGAVEAVGMVGGGPPATEAYGDEEGQGRHERERVLHPRGLHRLRAPGRREDHGDAGEHVEQRDHLEPLRAPQRVGLRWRQLGVPEPVARAARPDPGLVPAHDPPPPSAGWVSSHRSSSDCRAFSPIGTIITCASVVPATSTSV